MSETRNILLVEPDHLLRRTVVATARALFRVEIAETSRYENAQALTHSHRYDGLVLAVDHEDDRALGLTHKLRAGELASAQDSPVVLIGYALDSRQTEIVQALAVQRFIHKPVKVRHILEVMAQMAPPRAAPAKAPAPR